ncbi:hypothetical protein L1280_001487 [Deinococcus sp. HSC-46F16]|uniref:DUF1905 domain-containing protein n=1 Tax=Deinococcus sp. HSC-46F16 TaxID=2910968 RepID=UPI00209DAA70|nr:hypothetical protein [Deinococcus sp. HSC-46F16]
MSQSDLPLPSTRLEFSGPLWFWRGPAPWYFVTVPAEQSGELKAASSLVTYGWGMLPVRVQIGETQWKTSLFPKDDLYVLPVRASVRQAEGLEEGDPVAVQLELA